MKKVVFIGGDTRQKIAAEYLRKENFICEDYIFNLHKNFDVNKFDVVILPLPTSKDGINVYSPFLKEAIEVEKLIKNLNESQFLITGNYTPEFENFVDLNKDEDFAFKNAIPTAEGAIKILIESTDSTLWGSNVLIVGNGKIGKILSNRLSSFGANITVSARKSLDFSHIEAFGYKSLDTHNLSGKVSEFDIIINTVPSPVFTEELIKQTKENCLFLELSSAPFGIDKQAAISYDREYIYAPALPGKTAPKTAGVFLGETIKKIINETFWK